MDINKFDYNLPNELIAQMPLERRDQSRLLIINRKSGEISHGWFKDICANFKSPDALVFNDTKVRLARLIGRVAEREIDILLVERLSRNRYLVLAKPGKKLKIKSLITFAKGKYSAVCIESQTARQQGMKLLEFNGSIDIEAVLDEIGIMPLPPYIKRIPAQQDSTRYQTVYAKNPGAIASPTAGLHFTQQTLEELRQRDIRQIFLTLHVGLGTFLPVKSDKIEEHEMHKEYFDLSTQAAGDIKKTKQAGGRICAVGTTACRVLETCAKDNGNFSMQAGQGQTDLFIYPPYAFKAVDMLLTNFHLPRTTLLMLVSAFAGTELVLEAYRQAVEKKYRFFSYGDAMMII